MPLTRFDTQAAMGAGDCLSSGATRPISHGISPRSVSCEPEFCSSGFLVSNKYGN